MYGGHMTINFHPQKALNKAKSGINSSSVYSESLEFLMSCHMWLGKTWLLYLLRYSSLLHLDMVPYFHPHQSALCRTPFWWPFWWTSVISICDIYQEWKSTIALGEKLLFRWCRIQQQQHDHDLTMCNNTFITAHIYKYLYSRQCNRVSFICSD